MHGASRADIVCAPDNRPAVREYGQNVIIDFKPQQEGVALQAANAGEAVSDFLEGDFCASGRTQLNGVAATKDGRAIALLAGKPHELAAPAHAAVAGFAQSRKIDAANLVVPYIEDRQPAANGLAVAAQDFHRLGGFNRRDNADDGREDAGRVARGRRSRRRRFAHQARQAGRVARKNRHRLAFRADAAAVNPWHSVLDGEVVHEKSNGEVIGAVDDDIDPGRKFRDVTIRDIGNNRFDLDLGIDTAEFVRSCNRLGQTASDVLFVVQHLPLEIVEFEKIAIDDADQADARAHQRFRNHGAKGATAANESTPFAQLPLAFCPKGDESRLAVVSIWRRGAHAIGATK
jgi:hypothetical protein